MSAYLCSDETFTILGKFVSNVLRDDRHSRGIYVYDQSSSTHSDNYLSPKAVVEALFAENVRSVNARYNETSATTIAAETLTLTAFNTPKSEYLPLVARTIKCVECQSCKADDYYDTFAYKVLTALKNALLTQLAEGL